MFDKPNFTNLLRAERMKKRLIDRESATVDKKIEDIESTERSPDIDANLPAQTPHAEMIETETFYVDKSIQVNTRENTLKIKFHEYLLSSSLKLSIYTGITQNIFSTIEKLVKNTLLKLFPRVSSNNVAKKICLVLTKLKLDISFRALGILYEVSTTAQNYFHEYIQILYYTLKPAIYFPKKEENMSNLPKCFKKYKKVRIVLDATEINIQKTACLDCRIRTYSHYKKTHTSKFLISVSPAGLIAHVSAAYGGHVSDKAIFNEEGIINLLDPYQDAIMVDKGVLVEKECAEAGIQLIRPPFLRKKKQFSKEEAIETASIARARIHVERTIQRIKVFKIFSNKLQWSLVPYLTEMMTVICALVNLSKPILSNDKYITNWDNKC